MARFLEAPRTCALTDLTPPRCKAERPASTRRTTTLPRL